MRELDGELSWEALEDNDYDLDEERPSEYVDSEGLSEDPELFRPSDDEQTQETSDDMEIQDLFSARRATKLLLEKYPDAFSYDPKSMCLEQFLAPDKGLTEFGWLYLQMLAYSVSGKHYRYEDQSSLNTLAVSDCASWLDTKVRLFKGRIANLRAVLYTRMRNTMSNSLYKDNKYIPTEDTTLDRNFSPTSIVLECDEVDPFILDYSFKDVKEARLLSLKLWGFHEGVKLPENRNWTHYRFDGEFSEIGIGGPLYDTTDDVEDV